MIGTRFSRGALILFLLPVCDGWMRVGWGIAVGGVEDWIPIVRVGGCAKFSTFAQKPAAYYLCIYDSNYLYVRVFQRMLVRVFQRIENVAVRAFQRIIIG